MKARWLIVLVTLGGCSMIPGFRRNASSYSATGFDADRAAKSSVPGVTPEMASRYGCSWEQVESNWKRRRMAAARPGDPLCSVLGRYGQPFSVSVRDGADMKLLSLQYRPGERYINVVAVRYDDTAVNRKLNRRPGTWFVQIYSRR